MQQHDNSLSGRTMEECECGCGGFIARIPGSEKSGDGHATTSSTMPIDAPVTVDDTPVEDEVSPGDSVWLKSTGKGPYIAIQEGVFDVETRLPGGDRKRHSTLSMLVRDVNGEFTNIPVADLTRTKPDAAEVSHPQDETICVDSLETLMFAMMAVPVFFYIAMVIIGLL